MGADLDPLMAEARFAYRVQLPDGSEAIRTGGAAQPPTMGQLADYAANKGERFLGPVDMSPAPSPAAAAPPPTAAAAPPPAPAPAPVPAEPAAPPPSGIGTELRDTFLPRRTFTSELPSIGGGLIAGGVTAPFAPWGAIPAAGAGSMAGEAGLIGTEKLMGWPPAEPGTGLERMRRAYVRGATGEGLVRGVTLGGRAAVSAVRGPLKAAEELGPVLSRSVPAETTLVHAPEGLSGAVRALPIDEVVKNPAALRGVTVTPEMQETVLTRWWQTAAEGGPKQVVAAWDDLGKRRLQEAIAGDKVGAMSTVVNTLRASAEPLMTAATAGRATLTAAPLAYLGAPHAVTTAAALGEEAVRRGVPRLFLHPGPAGFLASIPQVGRVASPWASGGLRAAAQSGVAAAYRPPSPEEQP